MMRIFLILTISLLAVLIAMTIVSRTKNMTDNQKCIKNAREKIKQFETDLEAEHLRKAYTSLEGVNLAKEFDPNVRNQLRSECLRLWLEIINQIDQHIDPAFNRDDGPETLVQPPPTTKGVQYPPGANPALIDDPIARADYEKAIAANREKAKNYRMQIHLGRLNERVPPRAEAFICKAYSSSPEDRAEAKSAIEKTITNPARRESLLRLLESSKS